MKKYSHLNELSALDFLVNALGNGAGHDQGQAFPYSDVEDLSCGLRFIPGEVTLARRRGECVTFVQNCENVCCWYWQFSDGSRTYYWEPGNPGPCAICGNKHTIGGHIKRENFN